MNLLADWAYGLNAASRTGPRCLTESQGCGERMECGKKIGFGEKMGYRERVRYRERMGCRERPRTHETEHKRRSRSTWLRRCAQPSLITAEDSAHPQEGTRVYGKIFRKLNPSCFWSSRCPVSLVPSGMGKLVRSEHWVELQEVSLS